MIIDNDRTDNGDYHKKPTQFYFINLDPGDNLVLEPLDYVETLNIERTRKDKDITRQVKRSLIHPQYARRFILRHLAGGQND